MRCATLEESGLSKEQYYTYKISLKRKGERSLYEFYKMFFKTFIPSDYVDNFHIKVICDAFQEWYEGYKRGEDREDLLININPGESKSSVISVAGPVWIWIDNPKIRIMTHSHSSSLASEHLVNSREIIKSQLFQNLYGHKFEISYRADSSLRYVNNKGGFRKTNRIFGKITGKHVDLHIIDDALDKVDAKNLNITTKVNSYINEVISDRVTDKRKSRFLMVAQRLSGLDPSGDWLKKDSPRKVKHICLPATIDYEIKPAHLIAYYQDGLLNPHRTDKTVLERIKATLGTRQYNAEFGQTIEAGEEGVILRKWFDVIGLEECPEDLFYHQCNFYADTGDKDKEHHDPTGMLAVIYHPNQKIYVLDYNSIIARFSGRVDMMKGMFEVWASEYSKLYIEAKSSGVSVQNVLQEEPYNINAVQWERSIGSKEYRVSLCEGVWESKRVVFVDGLAGRYWVEGFLDNLTKFGTAGVHDEEADCLTMATIEEILLRLPAFERGLLGINFKVL